MNRACFPKEKTPEFTKMGELFVLALFLVGFAGATPDKFGGWQIHPQSLGGGVSEAPCFTVFWRAAL